MPLKFPREGITLRRALGRGEGPVGRARMGRRRDSPGPRRGRGRQQVALQRGHGRQGARAPDDARAEGRRRRPARQDHNLRQEPGHAEFIAQRFDVNYPHFKGAFARVIHSGMPYAQSLIDDFSNRQGAAHRHLGRHAGYRHRHSRGRQPRLLQAGPVEDEVLADGRARNAPVAQTCSARARTRSSSTSSITARTSSSSARTRRRRMARSERRLASGYSRPTRAGRGT